MTVVVVTGSREWPMDKAHVIWEELRKIDKYHQEDWHWSPYGATSRCLSVRWSRPYRSLLG